MECGYDLLDREIAEYELAAAAVERDPSRRDVVLIAPSWQEGNILDTCIDDMLKSVLGRGMRVVVRPHPEYTKRYSARWNALLARWADVPESELILRARLQLEQDRLHLRHSRDRLVVDLLRVLLLDAQTCHLH